MSSSVELKQIEEQVCKEEKELNAKRDAIAKPYNDKINALNKEFGAKVKDLDIRLSNLSQRKYKLRDMIRETIEREDADEWSGDWVPRNHYEFGKWLAYAKHPLLDKRGVYGLKDFVNLGDAYKSTDIKDLVSTDAITRLPKVPGIRFIALQNYEYKFYIAIDDKAPQVLGYLWVLKPQYRGDEGDNYAVVLNKPVDVDSYAPGYLPERPLHTWVHALEKMMSKL